MNHFDVLIVGAGLSGVGAAVHLQTHCPKKSYAILEGRERLGGTWDLFRYPGIRSDSDMYTLGYSFRPWTAERSIADGASILDYVQTTARDHGIDAKIRYQHWVSKALWSSADARWTVEVLDKSTNRAVTLTAQYIYVCAGYYDYSEGYTPKLTGIDQFAGRIVHPQHWPEELNYDNKKMIVIGSGATAVTLVPELAKRAAKVTMLQRSPTYIISLQGRDRIAQLLRKLFSPARAYRVIRWKNVLLGMALYNYCRRFPESAKRLLVRQVQRLVRGKVDVAAHFTPTYKPWDQRLCLVPDGDLFRALRQGKAEVITDQIDTLTERGIRLRSGKELEADIIVTATGLNLKFLGGLQLEVDGRAIDPSTLVVYKGMMFSGVPNLAVATGYTNASWTLKVDLSSEYLCRLLNYMDEKNYRSCVPRQRDAAMETSPLIDFKSSYVTRSIGNFPRQGSYSPWKLYQNYLRDRRMFKQGKLDDGCVEFR